MPYSRSVFFLLMMWLISLVYAEDSALQLTLATNTSLSVAEKPLVEVLEIISHRFRLEITVDQTQLNAGQIDLETPITFQARDLPLKRLLNRMLAPHGLGFRAGENSLIIVIREPLSWRDLRDALEHNAVDVTLATGEPLRGVKVMALTLNDQGRLRTISLRVPGESLLAASRTPTLGAAAIQQLTCGDLVLVYERFTNSLLEPFEAKQVTQKHNESTESQKASLEWKRQQLGLPARSRAY